MICSCCGLKITEKYHEIDNGHLCERCWNDPNLFFPEKFKNSEKWQKVLNLFSSTHDLTEKITLPVLKLRQKGVTLYSGKLKAKNLLKLYGIFGFQEDTLEGYQRDIYEEQVKDLYQYLINCPVAIMPGLFISVRESVNFIPYNVHNSEIEDFGILEVPLKKGALWIIDGQHRIASFEKILANITHFNDDNKFVENSFLSLMDYEIPVTFIDSKNSLRTVNNNEITKLVSSDIERMAFFIINKTQRRLSPSLQDTLQYLISRSGMNSIPVIQREMWRTYATALIIDLNALENSPLYKKINISGRRGLNRPIQLNSFVSSLRPLFHNEEFSNLNMDEKRELLFKYWDQIKLIYNNAFLDTNYREYLILKSIGVYTLNLLLLDYIKYCRDNDYDFLNKVNINNFITKMEGFDWSKDSSPIANFGGMKGVKEARIVLLDYMFGIKTISLSDS